MAGVEGPHMMHTPKSLRLAVVLGTVPLLTGTLVYGAWRFTRWHWLESAGLFIIALGLISFLVGVLALLRHLWSEWRIERTTRTSLWIQALLVGGLLFVNFPAAAFFALSAVKVVTRYSVRVHNDSDQPIESLAVTGPGVHVELGPIAPGQRVLRHLHFRGDGPLDFTARQQNVEFSGQLEGYVTGGLGGDMSIRIRERGDYEIQNNDA